jgi:hypothetical protein
MGVCGSGPQGGQAQAVIRGSWGDGGVKSVCADVLSLLCALTDVLM